ncbi:MAG: penicillin acylase family protein [Novosphingobium sp.]|nr:penicillin acylase family protein [Novosphingobium sp.]
MVRRFGWLPLILLLIVLVGLMTWEPFAATRGSPPPARDYAATITRDEFGVPHIHGRTDPDVTFGVAWAHSEDDFATLQDVLAMTRGRYGAIAGESGAATDFALALLDARGTARRRYPELPADVRALIDAYASGLNLYAAKHPREVKLARLFPVNGEDVATGFALRQPFFFGLDKVIKALAEETPFRLEHGPRLNGKPAPAFLDGGGDLFESDDDKPLPLPVGEAGAMAGSNAFAVAPARSGDGVTRLVSNSHQPYWGGVAWYELVIDSDSGWRFAGASFPGSPYPLLGHNDHLGWTNTVNRADLYDVYKLVLNEDRTHYRLDGEWLQLIERTVTLPVRFGPLVLPIRRTIWATKHGPAMLNRHGGFAFRYAGIDSIASLTQYYRLTKARNFAEWTAAMRQQAIPATNFVYADREGNIALVYNAQMPLRKPGHDWRGVVPGDDSSLIWRTTVGWEAMPRLVNPASGFLFNANNTPFVAAGPGSELDPKTFDPLLGIELDTTNRARRAVKLMSAARPLGRLELMRIKYDTGYERAGYVAWMLDAIARLDLRGEPELQRAQKLLATWDLTADGKGRADALANLVLQEAMSSSYGLKPAPDPKTELKNRVEHLLKHFGRIDPPLGEVLRIRQGPGPNSVDLPMIGGGDTLRAATMWKKDQPDGRYPVRHGDSFIQFVEWPAGGGPVTSRSIQPFGAATTRPDSPHYTDQAPLFAAHRTKPVHFTRADIAAHAVRRYVVSNR